jgi:hypothetical protein
MNAARLEAELTISLKAVRVFGTFVSSLNDHPPIDIQVCRPRFFAFNAVNLLYSAAEPSSIGVIWNEVGWKNAKAVILSDGSTSVNQNRNILPKFRCVKELTSRSSGDF